MEILEDPYEIVLPGSRYRCKFGRSTSFRIEFETGDLEIKITPEILAIIERALEEECIGSLSRRLGYHSRAALRNRLNGRYTWISTRMIRVLLTEANRSI